MTANIFNMPSGRNFLPELAAGLRAEFGSHLQEGLILLPTRRAVRAMGEAFVVAAQNDSAQSSLASLLPRMRPLADVNPEEPPFEPGELMGQVAPAIDPMQRRFELSKLIAHYYARITDTPLDPASAMAMSEPMLSIMDDAAMEETEFTQTQAWQDVSAQAAIHFQHAAELYKIIATYWPARLAELKLMEAQARKVKLLNLLTKSWENNPPHYPVIIAGSTGTLKATARLMRCVAHLPHGRIILPGLQNMTDDVWDNIDVQHPQYSLKNLLKILDVNRADVRVWPRPKTQPYRAPQSQLQSLPQSQTGSDEMDLEPRRLLLSEALVPVSGTGDWLARIDVLRKNGGADIFDKAVKGLSLIEARSDDEEAMVIAMIMRQSLETPDQYAALITPDQALATRVKARLKRWDIDVDMSQGGLLSETKLGVYLDSLIELAKDVTNPLALAIIFNQDFCCLGQNSSAVRAQWQALERESYRGVPDPDRPPKIPRGQEALVQALLAAISPLTALVNPDIEMDETGRAEPLVQHRPIIWVQALIKAAEHIAQSDKDGALKHTDHHNNAAHLWAGDSGEAAAQLLEKMQAYGEILQPITIEHFQKLLQNLMAGVTIRPKSGAHPRLSILGPLEARMLCADVVILGGLNEGIWPVAPKSGPFLSRSMRRAMALSLPERRYGLAAHDFAVLAASPKVYLTRAQRSGSGPNSAPMVASRWVWRLQTLLRGAAGHEAMQHLLRPDHPFLQWARLLDQPEHITPATPPEPRPPADKRWGRHNKRGLSITAMQTWIRDPYAIYARHCLGLSKLERLNAEHGPREFGSAMHKGIELFLQRDKAPFLSQHHSALVNDFADAMGFYGFAPEEIAKEAARFDDLARKFIDWLQQRREQGFDIAGQELRAEYRFPELDFSLRGVMDLAEDSPLGYSFTDHKTGMPSTAAVVKAGFDPQLPLAAFLAQMGAIETLKARPTASLGYLRIKGSNDGFEYLPIAQEGHKKLSSPQELIDDAVNNLHRLVKAYDKPSTAYYSQPRAQFTNKYGDYDDLARRGEWAGIKAEEQP